MSNSNNNNPIDNFDDMPFANYADSALLRGVYAFGFEYPTLIQQRGISAWNTNNASTATPQQQTSERESSVNDTNNSNNERQNQTQPQEQRNFIFQAPPGSGRTSAAIIGAVSRIEQEQPHQSQNDDENSNKKLKKLNVARQKNNNNKNNDDDGVDDDDYSGEQRQPVNSVQVLILSSTAKDANQSRWFAKNFSDFLGVTPSGNHSRDASETTVGEGRCLCLNEGHEEDDDETEIAFSSANESSSPEKQSKGSKPKSFSRGKTMTTSEKEFHARHLQSCQPIILTSTPEIVDQMIKNGTLELNNVKSVIIDDADDMAAPNNNKMMKEKKEAVVSVMTEIGDRNARKSNINNNNDTKNNIAKSQTQVCAITATASAGNNSKLPPETAQFLSQVFSAVSCSSKSSASSKKKSSMGKSTKNKNDDDDNDGKGIDDPTIVLSSVLKINCGSILNASIPSNSDGVASLLQKRREILNQFKLAAPIENIIQYYYESVPEKKEFEETKCVEKADDDDNASELHRSEMDLQYEAETKAFDDKMKLLINLFTEKVYATQVSKCVVFVNDENLISSVVDGLKEGIRKFSPPGDKYWQLFPDTVKGLFNMNRDYNNNNLAQAQGNRQQNMTHRQTARVFTQIGDASTTNKSAFGNELSRNTGIFCFHVSVIVTTPEIYQQSYDLNFKKYHFTRMIVNFDLPENREVSSYLIGRIDPVFKNVIEVNALSYANVVSCFPSGRVVNLVSGNSYQNEEMKRLDRICEYFDLAKVKKSVGESMSSTQVIKKMIGISDAGCKVH